ncbi:MAG: ACT domain-containing protein [Oscillospiraceae bacterium]
MRAIVSVFAKDRIGIIADVCVLISSMNVNILDLNQTIMNGFFTMVMLVDTSTSDKPFDEIRTALEAEGEKLELSIRIQREDIFDAMHRI